MKKALILVTAMILAQATNAYTKLEALECRMDFLEYTELHSSVRGELDLVYRIKELNDTRILSLTDDEFCCYLDAHANYGEKWLGERNAERCR